jgi:hypothetical protein
MGSSVRNGNIVVQETRGEVRREREREEIQRKEA